MPVSVNFKMSAFGYAIKIGECVAISSCEFFFTNSSMANERHQSLWRQSGFGLVQDI